jgi:S1-C subfamily serine protease
LAERPNFFARDVDIVGAKDKVETVKTSTGRIGLTLGELTPQQITEKHLTGVKGLYVKEVDPNGLAADVRPLEIRAGEVVTRINRVPVTTLGDFQRVVESLKPGDAIVLNLASYDRSSNPNRVVQRIVQFTYQ